MPNGDANLVKMMPIVMPNINRNNHNDANHDAKLVK